MENNRYAKEKKLVEKKMGFFTHLTVFILVNFYLLIPEGESFNLSDSLFIFGGWGIGLAVHFMKTFIFNESYIERAVERNMERE